MALNWFKKKKSKDSNKDTISPDNTSREVIPEDAIPEQAASEAESIDDDSPSGPMTEAAPASDVESQGKGLFAQLKNGLSKTRQILTTDLEDLFGSGRRIDDEFLEELEELLITSDIGVQTAMDLMDSIRRQASKIKGPEELKETLREEICALLDGVSAPVIIPSTRKPHVIMVVGVNGVGKTTTIGKLAARAKGQGQSVLITAADTFRAAAIEQLGIWAQRAGADLVKHKENSDPAAVVFDGMEAAVARGTDIVFIDTAGRLHTKVNLMEELKKIKRIIAKKIPDAPHEVLLVLDATTGQNAISQAKLFHEAIGVTGLTLTKLDGTAKGGIVVSICQTLNIPLKHIGVGESVEDLQPFDPQKFVRALL
jgi:fused signal recognition particle receptor